MLEGVGTVQGGGFRAPGLPSRMEELRKPWSHWREKISRRSWTSHNHLASKKGWPVWTYLCPKGVEVK